MADYKNPETGQHQILGVGRLSQFPGTGEAEFAMLVSDKYQHQGLGSELLRQLVQVGRDQGVKRITADILFDNLTMQHVCQKLGFKLARSSDMMKAVLEL